MIRQASTQDISNIQTMVSDNIDFFHRDNFSSREIEVWKNGYSPQKLRKHLVERKVFVMERARSLLAMIQLDQDEVKGLYVDPEALSQGLGRRMMMFIEKYALDQGLEGIRLTCNPEVKGFYQHLGYVEKGKEIVPWEEIQYEEFRMEKQLTDRTDKD